MCGIVLKVLFLGGLAAGVALTCVALASSYWVRYDDTMHWGLFKTCVKPTPTGSSYACTSNWGYRPQWRTAVAGLLFVSLVGSLFAFAWWGLACIGCCCQRFLTPPLPLVATVLFLLNLSAVITYAVAYKNDNSISGKFEMARTVWGYAFWCAVGSVISFGVTMLIGCGIVGVVKEPDRTAYRSI